MEDYTAQFYGDCNKASCFFRGSGKMVQYDERIYFSDGLNTPTSRVLVNFWRQWFQRFVCHIFLTPDPKRGK